MLWGVLIHIGYNLYLDKSDAYPCERYFTDAPEPYFRYSPRLEVADPVWEEIVAKAPAKGVNAMVLDLADGIVYESHPELAVEGAWSVARLKDEIARLRSLGIEALPKLNLSASHDAWLGEYSRMVSSRTYYQVVDDLIDEVCAIFDRPRFFHLGMDEETWENQKYYHHTVIREGDLWWHDLLRFAARVEEGGSRPWVWSDRAWHHPVDYLSRMPTSIVQSNWYYEPVFTGDESGRPKPLSHDAHTAYMTYLDLDEAGFDQIPAASAFPPYNNLAETAGFAAARLSPERLLGFMNTVWVPPTAGTRLLHLEMLDRVAEARRAYESVTADR
ncbi:MAG: hypothetical protein LBK95_14055 [Bifidobacteriaceae bacterium]|jgi:hypothetical protein|nr:hypothetical protein [Bifidobacteriaceae bacterium]